MPFVPVPNTALAEVRAEIESQKVENTLYFTKAVAWTPATLVALGNELLTWWTAEIAPLISTAATLREIFVTDLASQNGPTATVPAPSPAPTGANANTLKPGNASFCVSFRTVARGRSFRGRNFVYGLCDNQMAGSLMQPAAVAAFLAAYNDLFARATATSSQWVVVSRFSNKAPRSVGIASAVTAVVATDDIADSQRRRLPGRGK